MHDHASEHLTLNVAETVWPRPGEIAQRGGGEACNAPGERARCDSNHVDGAMVTAETGDWQLPNTS